MVSQMWPPEEVLLVLPPGAGVGGKLATPRGIHRGVAERACMHAARREPVGVQCSPEGCTPVEPASRLPRSCMNVEGQNM